MNAPLLVTLLRHGEVEGESHAFHGAADPPLSVRGWAQMRAALDAITSPPVNALVTSPLERCLAFATAAAESLQIPLEIDPRLAEMRFGDWEGLGVATVARLDPEGLAAFRADPVHATPPGAEPYPAFAGRVRTAFRRWTTMVEGHALLVTHAGVMRVLLAETLGVEPPHAFRIALPYAATCRLSLLPGEPPALLALNFAPAH